MDLSHTRDFVTLHTGPLESMGSLGYAELPDADTFHYTT